MSPRLTLIAAVARNGIIGVAGRLPWRLPGDLKFFKRTTLGKPLIMGRKTWDSLGGKPLPGRPHLVLTRDPNWRAEGALVVPDFMTAQQRAADLAAAAGADEIMVIGGEAVFAAALPLADQIYLTEVDATPDGDARFPAFDRSVWGETVLETQDSTGPDSPAFRVLRLLRR